MKRMKVSTNRNTPARSCLDLELLCFLIWILRRGFHQACQLGFTDAPETHPFGSAFKLAQSICAPRPSPKVNFSQVVGKRESTKSCSGQSAPSSAVL